jgi:hypothetical protein
LDKLLFENWDAIAADPLDKVFAIFRLASDGDQYGIEVDYEHGVNAVNGVYTNIIIKYIQLYGNLSIILPRRAQNPDHHLPSWCPDWSVSTPASRMGNWKDAYPFQVSPNSWDYFAAGPQSQAQVYFNTNQFMYARGFRIDFIHSDSKTIPDIIIEEEVPSEKSDSFWDNSFLRIFLCFGTKPRIKQRKATEFDKWYTMHRQALRSGFSRETTDTRSFPMGEGSFVKYCKNKHRDFFWILHRATRLFADEMPRENRSAMTRRMLRRWRQHRDIPRSYASRRRNETMGEGLREVTREMGEVEINEKYTCFFMTWNGFMGLGPEDLRERDLVVMLRGCGFPVVLRWEEFCYRLVGACYLPGFMFGEFWEKGWGNRVGEETFEIC